MKIKEIAFKNFGSYGNRLQKIQFDPNQGAFYVVTGHNGAGKSTISDVIKYGLYGKLDNKKNRDIPNRFNGNMYVKIVVEKMAGVEVSIERGLAPNFFRVSINGKEYDQAGKRNVQEFLEEEILGMPYYIFNNIVSLSINDFKSFLGMSPYDKRLIIDKLFGLEMLGIMRWHVKEHIKTIRESITNVETEISVLERSIETSSDELQILFEKLKSADEEKKTQLIESIQKVQAYIKEADIRLTEVEEREGTLKASLREIGKQLTEKQYELRTRKEKETLYNNDCCPTCGSDLHTDYHKNLLEQIAEESVEIEKELGDIRESQKKLDESGKKISEIKTDLNNKKTTARAKILALQKDLGSLSDELIKDEQTSSLKNIIEDSGRKREEAIKKKDEEEKKAHFYKIIEEVFGDRGVKLSAIKRIVPVLNQEVRKVLKDLNVDYRVTFGEDFGVKIMHMGYDVSVDQLSTGERKKVDFAVLIALIKIMKIKFHGLNLIFLDEIFSSIDSDGIWHILGVLSNTSRELGLHTFVINHSSLPTELFNYRVEIEKKNGFSELSIEPVS
jgi:DNA repair exonuclease SbcCD ATPase subunit